MHEPPTFLDWLSPDVSGLLARYLDPPVRATVKRLCTFTAAMEKLPAENFQASFALGDSGASIMLTGTLPEGALERVARATRESRSHVEQGVSGIYTGIASRAPGASWDDWFRLGWPGHGGHGTGGGGGRGEAAGGGGRGDADDVLHVAAQARVCLRGELAREFALALLGAHDASAKAERQEKKRLLYELYRAGGGGGGGGDGGGAAEGEEEGEGEDEGRATNNRAAPRRRCV